MKILLMADYPVGVELVEYLVKENETIVGFVKHPPELDKCSKKILELLSLPDNRIIDGRFAMSKQGIEKIKQLKPDVILCIFWGLILPPEILDIPAMGCINFHCSYLPFNRGKNPNVWPFIDGTPAGITIHYMDQGVDTGDIIAQRQIDIEPVDTAKTLYDKLTAGFLPLFKETWPQIKDGTAKRIAQDPSQSTFHYAKDFHQLDEIDLEKEGTGREFINLIRAKTFQTHPSITFKDESGKKVQVRIKLEYSQEDE